MLRSVVILVKSTTDVKQGKICKVVLEPLSRKSVEPCDSDGAVQSQRFALGQC